MEISVRKDFFKAVAAGMMIGIACMISLAVGGGYIGALLFSIGLVVIVLSGFNLYTGKVGYIKTYRDVPFVLLCLLGNIIGIFLASRVSQFDTLSIISEKLADPMPLVFLRALGCGYLMYAAVNTYKEKNTVIGTIGCVAAFILCGFEHSIADLFYIMASSKLTLEMLPFIVTVIIGNGFGAMLHNLHE